MNKVILKGRLTKDIEMRYSQATEPVAIANFSVAVNRKFKREGQPDSDFFNCVAFGKTSEFLEKYFVKGQEILLEGSIQNRSWEDSNGTKRYATDIIVDSVEFCGSKATNGEAKPTQTQSNNIENFAPIDESLEDDDLPF